MDDPLDELTAAGWRIAWLSGLGTLLILREYRVVIADPDDCRAHVATRALRHIAALEAADEW